PGRSMQEERNMNVQPSQSSFPLARVGSSTPSPIPKPLHAPHSMTAESVVAQLGSNAARGLSRDEARRRIELYGPNELRSAPETPWWKRLLEQFENVLVLILLGAIVISTIEWAL